jgi:hypothetical protein
LSLIQRGEPKPWDICAEQSHGMGIEGGDDDGTPLGAGASDCTADDRLMTKVKPVKIPQRHDAPAQMSGDRDAAFKPLHGGGYRDAPRRWQCGFMAQCGGGR